MREKPVKIVQILPPRSSGKFCPKLAGFYFIAHEVEEQERDKEKAAHHTRALTLALPLGLSSWQPGQRFFFLSVLLFPKGMWAAPCGRRGAAGSAARTPAGTRGRSEHFKMLLNTSPRAYFIAFPKPGIKHGVYRMSPAAALLKHSCKSPS